MVRRQVLLSAAATAALALSRVGSGQAAPPGPKDDITGSWRVRIVGGPGTPPLPSWYGALATFDRDGGLVATIRDSSISTGHGAWTQTKHREFSILIELPVFDASGDFAGTLKATATLKLDESGSTFSSDDYAFERLDKDGNSTGFAGVGQAFGTRITIP